MFWTLELRELGDTSALGTIRNWITTVMPIGQPTPPLALAGKLLADRGLKLLADWL
ncbi:MAG TPA: hypothetical protein VN748_05485 [Pseudonocardiaceae bacterium]|jgi:hypothetical protein|nr:hypothetical protein [Pseudonocardiaceae bacterium]